MTRRVGGEAVRDKEILTWATELLATILGEPAAPATAPGA
jgi:hypothetical protein